MCVQIHLLQRRLAMCGGSVEDEVALGIGFPVSHVSFVVVIGFLPHGNKQDKGEGGDISDYET